MPASAASDDGVAALLDAFSSICYEKAGNVVAQASAAKEKMSLADESTEESLLFKAAGQRLQISGSDKSCMITGNVSEQATFASVLAAVSGKFDLDEGQKFDDPGYRAWVLDDGEQEIVLALNLDQRDDLNLVTLLIQPRATLSRD